MSGLLLLRRPSYARCLSSRLSQVRHYALIGKPRVSDEPKWTLPKTPARTRFAPSPTGYLHLGSLRTALYNYLLAQATGGQFIIRLEDTDQARLVSDAEQVLYDDLRWAGLHWDEGPDKGGPFGPYKQSERLNIYTEHAQSLLESGHAFRCFCSKEDLEFNVQQATASGGAAHYPGTCTHVEKGESDRRAANGEPHVVRFKSAEKPVTALDLVYGNYKKAEQEDNFIIMKSDGFPTYHFANVVDDHFMKITHVVRGAEWLISTPKHVELYNALGWQPPNFAHVGLLVDAQRQKLSKRDMANIGIGVYRSTNVMPEALLNFSALLGWDPNLQKNTHLNKRGVMTLKEMKENFTLKFTRGDIIVDLSKLKFFQKQLTRSLITGENPDSAALSKQIIQPISAEVEQITKGFQGDHQREALDAQPHLREVYDSLASKQVGTTWTFSEDYVLQVLKAWKGSVDDPFHFVKDNLFAFFRPSKDAMRIKYKELQTNMARIMLIKSDRKTLINTDISKVLKAFIYKLSLVKESDWTAEKLGDIVKKLVDSAKFYDTLAKKDKFESAGWLFMRYGLVNGQPGSALVPLMLLFGQQETVYRMRQARKVAAGQEKLMDKERKKAHSQRSHPNAGSVPEPEPRNETLATVSRRKAELTGKDPIEIAMEERKRKEQALEEGPFGPFKSRPPPPPPEKSPPRDPSEVERAPQFLSRSEFMFGTRHIGLRRNNFGDILETPQSQRSAQSQDSQAPETAQVDAIFRPLEGDWVTYKPRVSQLQDEHSNPEANGTFEAQGPFGSKIQNHDKRTEDSNDLRFAGMAVKSDKFKEPGPFRPKGVEEIVDKSSHVERLRALNAAVARNRELAEMRRKSGLTSTGQSRLQMLIGTGLGPMAAGEVTRGPMAMEPVTRGPVNPSAIFRRKKPQRSVAKGSKKSSRKARTDGERATALVTNDTRLTEQVETDTSGHTWGTSQGLDYHGEIQAAAESKAQKKAEEEEKEKAAPAQTEQQKGEKSG